MNTYLLTWNPRSNTNNAEAWLASVISTLECGSTVSDTWSSGNRKDIAEKSVVFLLRQGTDRPGIVGTGVVARSKLRLPHWDAAKSRQGIKANYVLVDWQKMLPLDRGLGRKHLIRGILSETAVNTQCSGTIVEPGAARRLAAAWKKHISSVAPKKSQSPHESFNSAKQKWIVDDSLDDLSDDDTGLIGTDGVAPKKKMVSGYPRDPRVRRSVLQRSHRICERDGCGARRQFRGFIDIHHILGAAKGDRVWNCVALCPNCHREAHYSPTRDEINRRLLKFAAQFKRTR